MKIWNKSLSLGLSFIFFLSSLPLPAQTLRRPSLKASGGTEWQADNLWKALQDAAFVRRPDMTADQLYSHYLQTGYVDGAALAAVLSDRPYIQSLSLEEAARLIEVCSVAEGRPGDVWEDQLLEAVLSALENYDENSEDSFLQEFYALAAVSLGHHPRLWRKVESWAFGRIKDTANSGPADAGWAATLLSMLAVHAENDPWPEERRVHFERRLETLIRQFDWLQYNETDYKLPGLKNISGISNQQVLISLFAQVNSFFALKEDDGFFKQMVSTGALNPLIRVLVEDSGGAGHVSRTGETFYFSFPIPGTDGKGNFTASLNGRRHYILFMLVQALFLSYNTRDPEESSRMMQQFVRDFLQTDNKGQFRHYLFIPLQGMSWGAQLHYYNSLYGWEKEEAALQNELYAKLKEGYPWDRVCAGIQGACEVAVEWYAAGKILGAVFRGLGWVGKTVGRQGLRVAFRVLPPKTLLYAGLGQLAVKQGKKTIFRWSRQGIRNILRACGWKTKASAAGVPGAVSAGEAFHLKKELPRGN